MLFEQDWKLALLKCTRSFSAHLSKKLKRKVAGQREKLYFQRTIIKNDVGHMKTGLMPSTASLV